MSRYTDVNDRDEDILSARFDYTPSEDTEFYLKGYFHDWDTDYYPPRIRLTRPSGATRTWA